MIHNKEYWFVMDGDLSMIFLVILLLLLTFLAIGLFNIFWLRNYKDYRILFNGVICTLVIIMTIISIYFLHNAQLYREESEKIRKHLFQEQRTRLLNNKP